MAQQSAPIDKYAAVAKLFHQFVERQYDVSVIFRSSRARSFSNRYRIYYDKKFGDVTDVMQYKLVGDDQDKKYKIIFEYNTQEIERQWLYKICDLAGVHSHNIFEINIYIRNHHVELIPMRQAIVDKHMRDILAGFRDSRYIKYILDNPSRRMLSVGVCALTCDNQLILNRKP